MKLRLVLVALLYLSATTWESKSFPRSQAGLSLYELSGGLISRVYYYPVEK